MRKITLLLAVQSKVANLKKKDFKGTLATKLSDVLNVCMNERRPKKSCWDVLCAIHICAEMWFKPSICLWIREANSFWFFLHTTVSSLSSKLKCLVYVVFICGAQYVRYMSCLYPWRPILTTVFDLIVDYGPQMTLWLDVN